MERQLAVILGAGPVGLAVGERLKDKGWSLRFVTKSGRPVAVEGAEVRAADIRDPAALTTAAHGAQLIVHAVGVPYPDWGRELPSMQNSVLAAAKTTGAPVVFVENLYSYRATSMPLTEASAEEPPTVKGALRHSLSHQWLEAHAAGKIRAVSVRASDYFGPGATRTGNSHFGSRFFPGLEAGKPVAFLGNPDALHSFTYLPDFARALVDVALAPDSWGQAWICPSVQPTTARHVAGLIAREAGLEVKVSRLPSLMVKALGLFNPMIREVGEMLYQFEREFTVDATAFETRFGWKATSVEDAVRQTWAAHKA